tara:strand:+ start:1941 stop:2285 length:345 start_codon:yes stop_codon:yes gene_type:complete
MLLKTIIFISAISFLFYGLNCLFNKNMFQEFKRFGLSNFRKLTGVLQLLGAVGLLLGFFYPILTLVASSGLSLLMLLGFLVRLKIKDGLLVSLPAFTFMFLNLYILFASYQISY